MKDEIQVLTPLKVGDQVKIFSEGRKENGQIGTLRIIRHSEYDYHFVVRFTTGDVDLNDFKESELEKV